MSCTNTGPFDGGTYNDPIITNPTVVGGDITNATASNLSLTGSVTVDDSVAQQLASALCSYIGSCFTLDASEVAAVFQTCAGASHVANAQIPTCDEMNDAIADATSVEVSTDTPATSSATSIPTTIVGTSRDQVLGKPATYIKLGNYIIPAYTAS